MASARVSLRPSARASERATWVTCRVWVSRVTKWSPSGLRKTCVLCLSRRNAFACRIRSRSRSNAVRSGSSGSGRSRPRDGAARDRGGREPLLGALARRPVDAVERPVRGHQQSCTEPRRAARRRRRTRCAAPRPRCRRRRPGTRRPTRRPARSRPGCPGRRPAARAGRSSSGAAGAPASRATARRQVASRSSAVRQQVGRPGAVGAVVAGQQGQPDRHRVDAVAAQPGDEDQVARGSCSSSRRRDRSSPRARRPGRRAWWR